MDPKLSDYEDDKFSEVPYLGAHGVSLGRVSYGDSGAPGADLHVFLELADHLGSTGIVIDKATGELVERTTYQAYGATESDYRPERWNSFREDHRFTGKEEDVEVGLTYFGARYYAAALGRWISPDPLAVHAPGQADLNLYAYVHGAVLRATDPTGLADDSKSTVNMMPEMTIVGTPPTMDQRLGGAIDAAHAADVALSPTAAASQGGDTYRPSDTRVVCENGCHGYSGEVSGWSDHVMYGMQGGAPNFKGPRGLMDPTVPVKGLANGVVAGVTGTLRLALPFSLALPEFDRVEAKLQPITYRNKSEARFAMPFNIVGQLVLAKAGGAAFKRLAFPDFKVPNCFVAGTMVLTPAGLQAIEEITFGDVVISRDPASPSEDWVAVEEVDWFGSGDAQEGDGGLVYAFEPRRGEWELVSVAQVNWAQEFLLNGTLYSRDSRGWPLATGVSVDVRALADAARTFDGLAQPPRSTDWVLVLGGAGSSIRHLRLSLVGDGAYVAFQGKVFATRRREERQEIRETGETLQRVRRPIHSGTDRLVRLHVRSGGSEHALEGTPEHPFFAPRRSAFVGMGALEVGMVLLGEYGHVAEASRVEFIEVSVDTFNLEVERTHSYFVCDSLAHGCELVHNQSALEKQAAEVIGRLPSSQFFNGNCKKNARWTCKRYCRRRGFRGRSSP